MSSMPNKHTFKIVEEGDIPELMVFLDKHWSPGHILSRSHDLLRWQYYNKRRHTYNFVMAKDTLGNVSGILGFIPTSHYDPDINEHQKLIWLNTWIVRADVKGGIGLNLLNYLYEMENSRMVIVVGLNQDVLRIYKTLQFKTGCMDHFFILNPQKTDFALAQLESNHVAPPDLVQNSDLILDSLNENTFTAFFDKLYEDQQKTYPIKTSAYFIARYLCHPFYQYQTLGVSVRGKPRAIIVYRSVFHEGHEALRIVDLVGETVELGGLGAGLANLLVQRGAEYIDLYCAGVPEEDMTVAGLMRHDQNSPIVIPNYFEPFVRKNTEILFACSPALNYDCRIFKGDSDQDRPSKL